MLSIFHTKIIKHLFVCRLFNKRFIFNCKYLVLCNMLCTFLAFVGSINIVYLRVEYIFLRSIIMFETVEDAIRQPVSSVQMTFDGFVDTSDIVFHLTTLLSFCRLCCASLSDSWLCEFGSAIIFLSLSSFKKGLEVLLAYSHVTSKLFWIIVIRLIYLTRYQLNILKEQCNLD